MASIQDTSPASPQAEPAPTEVPAAPPAGPVGAKEKVGIGGCLLYPLLVLVAQPLFFIRALTVRPRPQVSLPGTHYYYRVYWPNVVFDMILVAICLVILVAFLRKKAVVPGLFMAGLAATFTVTAFYAIVAPTPPYGAEDPVRSFMVAVLQSFIIIPYLALSRRVKDTFVRELDPGSMVDRAYMPLARPLTRLYGRIARSGRWVFLQVLGFAAAVIAAAAAADALFGRAVEEWFMRFR